MLLESQKNQINNGIITSPIKKKNYKKSLFDFRESVSIQKGNDVEIEDGDSSKPTGMFTSEENSRNYQSLKKLQAMTGKSRLITKTEINKRFESVASDHTLENELILTINQ